MNASELSSLIRSKALELGFDACGFAKAGFMETEARRLEEWLSQNRNASMGWMENNFEKRTDPTLLVPGAKSVISVLMSFHHPSHKKYWEKDGLKIAKYAQGRDYHKVVKKQLKLLYKYIEDTVGNVEGRFFTDSAPVLDKAWAVRAGLGWIGKHSNLINKEMGSYFFIGEIILDVDLIYSSPQTDHCGACTKCLDACPTNAIYEPYRVDASKCISYQTIEHRGEFEEGKGEQLHDFIFGCDICLDVCPWNSKATLTNFSDFHPRADIMAMTDADWLSLSEEKYNDLFFGTPVKRAKYEGLVRNIKHASGS